MRIGGFQKFSLIDYPQKVAAVIFTQGCDFRCPFCHNPDLVLPERFLPPVDQEEILKFLQKRQDQLSGVVVTGGEPTIHADLPEFLAKIKELGFAIKLDTNGNNPKALRALISDGLIDYIAMDIKTSLGRYREAAGIDVDVSHIQESVRVIIDSGIDYHFRTTLVCKLVSNNDLQDIADSLKDAKKYFLQTFSTKTPILDSLLKDARPYTEEEFQALKARWEKNV